MKLPTVKVARDNERGFRVINESDFDPKLHVRVDDDQPKPVKAAKAKK